MLYGNLTLDFLPESFVYATCQVAQAVNAANDTGVNAVHLSVQWLDETPGAGWRLFSTADEALVMSLSDLSVEISSPSGWHQVPLDMVVAIRTDWPNSHGAEVTPPRKSTVRLFAEPTREIGKKVRRCDFVESPLWLHPITERQRREAAGWCQACNVYRAEADNVLCWPCFEPGNWCRDCRNLLDEHEKGREVCARCVEVRRLDQGFQNVRDLSELLDGEERAKRDGEIDKAFDDLRRTVLDRGVAS
jgi:hypothetical protein